MTLIVNRAGAMLNPVRYDNKLTRFDNLDPVAKRHPHLAFDHEEQLILCFVGMPLKVAPEFGELKMHIVHPPSDLWRPGLVELREFLG